MKNKVICFHIIFVLMFIALSFSTAIGITNGEPDGGEHPYVGLAVFDDASGNPLWRCSGTLLSPTLFLTTGHCTEAPAVRATIWFEEDVESGIPANGYPFGGPTSVDGTVYTHPDYDSGEYSLHDLGVVVLDEPVYMDEYGVLPELGILNQFKKRRGRQDVTFTAVGYGLQKINPVFVEGERVRLQATVKLIDLVGVAKFEGGSYVKVSANAHTGGTCFGDSGGPLFLNDTNIVAAVVSSGLNGNCRGVSLEYRVDTADDLDWLYGEYGDLLSSECPCLSVSADTPDTTSALIAEAAAFNSAYPADGVAGWCSGVDYNSDWRPPKSNGDTNFWVMGHDGGSCVIGHIEDGVLLSWVLEFYQNNSERNACAYVLAALKAADPLEICE